MIFAVCPDTKRTNTKFNSFMVALIVRFYSFIYHLNNGINVFAAASRQAQVYLDCKC